MDTLEPPAAGEAAPRDEVYFLKLAQVIARVGLQKSQIYDMERRGLFPRRVPVLGTNVTRWVDREVAEYQAACIRARNAAGPAGTGGA